LNSQISTNLFDFVNATNSVGIQFPTTFNSISQIGITNNQFAEFGTGSKFITGFQGQFGSITMPNGQSVNGAAQQEVVTLATDEFFPIDGTQVGAEPTEANVKHLVSVVGQAYRMACTTSAAPGNVNATRTIVLRDNAADTALTCTIGTAGTSCNSNTVAQVAIAAGDLLNYRTRCNVAACAGVENLSCVLYVSYDGGGVL
jgi:hypothetical protein